MNNFQNFFMETKTLIDNKLQEYLANDESLLKGLLDSINYSLFSGGKRIRPLFCFMVGELFNVQKENLISLACALEMIHTSSLIMDDLPHMDDAKLRRGKPANHLIYGQDIAALASIGLLTRAYEIVLDDPLLPDDKKAGVVSKLVNTVGVNGMVGGQFVDLTCSDESIDSHTLDFIHIHKTASLFVAAGTTSAIIGNATEKQINSLEIYASNVGFAFQILDDLLDSDGKVEEAQKTLRSDKGNYISVYGIEKSKQLIQEHTNKGIEAIKVFNDKNEKLLLLSQILLNRNS